MFRRDKDSKETKLDNEGLRRMREAIRQRIEQEEGEQADEVAESSPYRTTLPMATPEDYNPPPTSYEPLGRESTGRDTEYSFLGTPRQERRATPTAPTLPDRAERQERGGEDAAWEAVVPAEPTPMITTVAVDTAWRGTLHSSGPIRIEGAFEGKIVAEGELQIAPEAKVEATVHAASIIVAGQLNGQINCRERLEILPSGRVSGQIDAGRFIVHEGAFLGGQVRMRTPGERAAAGEENRPVLQRVR
ncbi:MAG TPA: polymer-forming cytoskeletal protein [Thermomicrobiales bacterium]|jgi:cytoskeletal protein CcmA (bactofilin family)